MEANSDKEAAARSGKTDLSVLEMIQIPVFVADQDGKMVYGNDAFAELVGVKREKLPGIPVLSLIQSETSGMKTALATGSRAYVETWATVASFKDRKYFLEYRPIPSHNSK